MIFTSNGDSTYDLIPTIKSGNLSQHLRHTQSADFVSSAALFQMHLIGSDSICPKDRRYEGGDSGNGGASETTQRASVGINFAEKLIATFLFVLIILCVQGCCYRCPRVIVPKHTAQMCPGDTYTTTVANGWVSLTITAYSTRVGSICAPRIEYQLKRIYNINTNLPAVWSTIMDSVTGVSIDTSDCSSPAPSAAGLVTGHLLPKNRLDSDRANVLRENTKITAFVGVCSFRLSKNLKLHNMALAKIVFQRLPSHSVKVEIIDLASPGSAFRLALDYFRQDPQSRYSIGNAISLVWEYRIGAEARANSQRRLLSLLSRKASFLKFVNNHIGTPVIFVDVAGFSVLAMSYSSNKSAWRIVQQSIGKRTNRKSFLIRPNSLLRFFERLANNSVNRIFGTDSIFSRRTHRPSLLRHVRNVVFIFRPVLMRRRRGAIKRSTVRQVGRPASSRPVRK